MPPEAPMGRRLVALSLHSGTEPTPGPLAYIPPLLPSVCLFTAPSCQAHGWAWQEQHQPGRYRAYSPVGQAHVKCRNTLRSHSDDAVKGTLGATRAKRRGPEGVQGMIRCGFEGPADPARLPDF